MDDNTPMVKRILIAVCIAFGTVLGLVLYYPGLRPQPHQAGQGTPAIGGPFTLVDSKGTRVTEAVLKGHYSLVYFGYTNCPDICPLALHNISLALEMAGPVAESVLPVFITVDPERDTPQIMEQYIANFQPRFLALTGTSTEVAATMQSYRVYAAKAAAAKAAATGDYAMQHTDFIYLMSPDGKYVTHFDRDSKPADIAARLRRELGAHE
jgi:protein SCO1/2